MTQAEQLDTTQKALDRVEPKADQSQQDLSSSLWDDIKNNADKYLQVANPQKESLEFLDLSIDSLYSSSFDTVARKGQAPRDSQPGERSAAKPQDSTADRQIAQSQAPGNPEYFDRSGRFTDNPSPTVAGINDTYTGHVINRDVPPGNHTVQRGDTLWGIAHDHLGRDAKPAEIAKHVEEIQRLNNIKNANVIRPGQELVLPGHTTDGGFVTNDAAGNKHTRWSDGTERVENRDNTGLVRKPDGSEHHWGPRDTDNYDVSRTSDGGTSITDNRGTTRTRWDDGVVRVENSDGTGYVRRPDAATGGYAEHHWGPNPQDNYELTKTSNASDARYLVQRQGEAAATDRSGEVQIQTEQARLRDSMDTRITNPDERARFEQDMRDFETNARARGVSDAEIARTYSEVSRLLNSQGDVPVTQAERVRVAEQIMHQSAHPEQIQQGQHGTCNVATVESRMYYRNPAEAAKMVTDVTTTGQFTTASGRTITVDAGSLQGNMEEATNPPADSQRSQASRIFQVTAANIYYDQVNQSTTPPRQLRYEQRLPAAAGDNGERVMDYATNPAGVPALDAAGNPIAPPGIPLDALQGISNEVSGQNETGFVLLNGEYGAPNTVRFRNEGELHDELARMQREGKLPAIIWVDGRNEPFHTDGGFGAAGGAGRAHVVTITHYDADTHQATMDNQWSRSADHNISTHDLFQASRDATRPSTVADMQKDVTWDRDHGTVDGFKEFELLRLQKLNNSLTDTQYDDGIVAAMQAQRQRWDEHGETYPGERARAEAHYQTLLRQMPAARAAAIRTRLV